jgi:hypothetical protein
VARRSATDPIQLLVGPRGAHEPAHVLVGDELVEVQSVEQGRARLAGVARVQELIDLGFACGVDGRGLPVLDRPQQQWISVVVPIVLDASMRLTSVTSSCRRRISILSCSIACIMRVVGPSSPNGLW